MVYAHNIFGYNYIDLILCLWYRKLGKGNSMDYADVSRIIIIVCSLGMTIGIYFQTIRVWKRKSAQDLSAVMVVAILVSAVGWLNYGFAIREWPILVIDFATLPADIGIAIGYLMFRKGSPNSSG